MKINYEDYKYLTERYGKNIMDNINCMIDIFHCKNKVTTFVCLMKKHLVSLCSEHYDMLTDNLNDFFALIDNKIIRKDMIDSFLKGRFCWQEITMEKFIKYRILQ